MIRFGILAAGAALSICSPAIAGTTIVNVNGFTNASLDGANALNVALGAGTYTLTFTQGEYTAFSRFATESGCDSMGGNCATGFENSVRYIIGGQTFFFGDGAATGGIGPIAGGGYYNSAALSFANAGKYTTSFTLNAPGNVGFYLYDDNLGDNRAGVSLSLAGVPEPSAWALLIVGFGVVGAGLRARKRQAIRAYA